MSKKFSVTIPIAPQLLASLVALVGATPALAQVGPADLLDALTEFLDAPVLGDGATQHGDVSRVLFQRSASQCREALGRAWDEDQQITADWAMVGVANDVARQSRIYTLADRDGALWSVTLIAADMCYLEFDTSGHRAPSDVWRLAPPILEPIGTDPVELPW